MKERVDVVAHRVRRVVLQLGCLKRSSDAVLKRAPEVGVRHGEQREMRPLLEAKPLDGIRGRYRMLRRLP